MRAVCVLLLLLRLRSLPPLSRQWACQGFQRALSPSAPTVQLCNILLHNCLATYCEALRSPPVDSTTFTTRPEHEAMESYIGESLASGLIVPSSSPVGAGSFFVKKDGSLRPRVDYRSLNKITV